MGKTGRKNKSYSPEFKISVIMDMREHKLGYNETIRKYWDDGLVGNHFRQIKLWERIFLEEGAEGLMKERRGKSCSANILIIFIILHFTIILNKMRNVQFMNISRTTLLQSSHFPNTIYRKAKIRVL
ncbi:MAG: hypothetical protein E7485_00935 [Ruminococcaceae bacterium]|nr:hypothetical protein [Oscillospiraceae bacterium]